MSDKSATNKVGKNNPPLEHRFSKENQPKHRGRRKSRDPEIGIWEILSEVLQGKITVSKKGKATEADVFAGMIHKLVEQILHGSASDKMKFLDMLMKSGFLDIYRLEAELKQERREEEKSNREYRKRLMQMAKEACESADLSQHLLYLAASVVKLARNKCNCGAFEGPGKEVYHQIEGWLSLQEEALKAEEDSSTEAASTSGEDLQWGGYGTLPPVPDDNNNEFYTGQIGWQPK